ncbi:hypothetical protein Patl1_02284 [Pistacia atlantica]|uniref:Uncharacterized protein n=1 Tax=Pistacia atlantica TaxID=434234 RepID=A0ACC1C654_9ROSI|nr:hypothetical protein Patl1_02284 [Pistacia atlantica]
MEYKSFCSCLFAVLLGLITSSQAYKFYVGGKDGWVLKPSESYNHWAERMRFQVNDTLYFKYNKDSNSVLVVNKDDYYSCNAKYPIQSLSDGDSVFHFNRSGPHYFISGNADNCNNGQKVIIVVMAVRHHHHHAPPSPSPLASLSPASHPSLSPPVESPHTSTPPSTLTEPPKSSSGNSSDIDSPAPAPSKSGSADLASSAGSVLGFSVVASVVLGICFKVVKMEGQDDDDDRTLEKKMLPPPVGVFQTREDLLKHVRDFALTQGYMISIKDSSRDIYIKTPSRLTNFPFEVVGKKDDDVWALTIKSAEHNHEPSKEISDHPSCRRFTEEEVLTIREMTDAGKKPRQILKALRKRNPSLVSDSRNVSMSKLTFGARFYQVRKIQVLLHDATLVIYVFSHQIGLQLVNWLDS